MNDIVFTNMENKIQEPTLSLMDKARIIEVERELRKKTLHHTLVCQKIHSASHIFCDSL